FYVFDMGLPLQLGAILINIGVTCYLANVLASSFNKNSKNVHAWYVITANLWLFATTFFGLLLVLNFRTPILSKNSVDYVSFNSHLWIIVWFLLMLIGVC